jgi:hypothetical protein
MTPFADEGIIHGTLCEAGDYWHLQMLKNMLTSGMTYNAYSTAIEELLTTDGVDCWLGTVLFPLYQPTPPREQMEWIAG